MDIIFSPLLCIGWIIVGAIAGSLARNLMGAADRSFVSDVVLGIAGAIVGGFLAGLVGLGPSDDAGGIGLVLINLVIATVGAMLLIQLRRMLT
jgi:uncharacterized membrane protein YeaQ/YmgE (transglycosylase-associated protein family)